MHRNESLQSSLDGRNDIWNQFKVLCIVVVRKLPQRQVVPRTRRTIVKYKVTSLYDPKVSLGIWREESYDKGASNSVTPTLDVGHIAKT